MMSGWTLTIPTWESNLIGWIGIVHATAFKRSNDHHSSVSGASISRCLPLGWWPFLSAIVSLEKGRLRQRRCCWSSGMRY